MNDKKPDQFVITDSDERIIAGWASVQVVDKQNDIVPVDVLQKAMYKFMDKGGLILYGHQNIPVGKVLKWEIKEHPDTKKLGLWIEAKIYNDTKMADEVWKAIKQGTIRGFSISGIGTEDKYYDKEAKKTVDIIKELELYEISLCEEPANPYAVIEQINWYAKSTHRVRRSKIKKEDSSEKIIYPEDVGIELGDGKEVDAEGLTTYAPYFDVFVYEVDVKGKKMYYAVIKDEEGNIYYHTRLYDNPDDAKNEAISDFETYTDQYYYDAGFSEDKDESSEDFPRSYLLEYSAKSVIRKEKYPRIFNTVAIELFGRKFKDLDEDEKRKVLTTVDDYVREWIDYMWDKMEEVDENDSEEEEEWEEEEKSAFKVGDKVKIIEEPFARPDVVGRTGTVVEVLPDKNVCVVRFDDGSETLVGMEKLKRIERVGKSAIMSKDCKDRYMADEHHFKEMTCPDDPSKKSRFCGCVRYMMSCQGKSLEAAKKICATIYRRKYGKSLDKKIRVVKSWFDECSKRHDPMVCKMVWYMRENEFIDGSYEELVKIAENVLKNTMTTSSNGAYNPRYDNKMVRAIAEELKKYMTGDTYLVAKRLVKILNKDNVDELLTGLETASDRADDVESQIESLKDQLMELRNIISDLSSRITALSDAVKSIRETTTGMNDLGEDEQQEEQEQEEQGQEPEETEETGNTNINNEENKASTGGSIMGKTLKKSDRKELIKKKIELYRIKKMRELKKQVKRLEIMNKILKRKVAILEKRLQEKGADVKTIPAPARQVRKTANVVETPRPDATTNISPIGGRDEIVARILKGEDPRKILEELRRR